MSDVMILEYSAIEKLLDKYFTNTKNDAKDIAAKYEKLTGEKIKLEDISKEVIEFIIEAKDQFNSLSIKTKEATYSIENLTNAIKNIVAQNKEGSNNASSSTSSISVIQQGFIKMKDSVINGTKRMFDGGIGLIKGFFGDISRRASSMMDSILAPFKNLLGALMLPFKMIGNLFSGIKGFFTEGLSSLFGSKNSKEDDNKIVGLSSRPLSEHSIMKRTSVGVATTWLWKKMEKRGGGGENSGDGILDTMKDLALLSGKGGILATTMGLLGKLAVLVPIVAGVGAMGFDLFKKGKKWWNAKTPEEKRDAGEDVAGSASVSAGGMVVGGAIGAFFGGPIGMKIGAALGGGIASLITSDEFKKKVGKAWYAFTDKVSEWTIAGAKMVGRFLDKAWEMIPSWDDIKGKWDSFKESAKKGWDTLSGWATTAAVATGEFMQKAWDMVPSMDDLKGAWNSAVDKSKELWASFKDMLPTWEGIKESFSNLGTSIVDSFSTYIGEPIMAGWNALPTWNEFKTSVIDNFNTYIGEPLGNLGASIAGWLGGIKDKLSGWRDSATSWWDSLWEDSKTMEERSAEFKIPDKADTSGLTLKERREIEEGKKQMEEAVDAAALKLGEKIHDEELKRLRQKQGIQEEVKGIPGLAGSNPIEDAKVHAEILEKKAEKATSAALEESKQATLETLTYSQMTVDQLNDLMSDISVSETEKETIWAELEARKKIDENINESVTSFSETIEKLLDPLKKFTDELRSAITPAEGAAVVTGTVAAVIQRLTGKLGDAKDKATGVVKDAVGSVSTGPKALGSGSTPLAFDSSKGGIELSGGRYKGTERFNSVEDAIIRTIQLNEGSMNSVNKNDKNGKNDIGAGVSLGFAQWNGGRARDLLKRMQQQDPEAFKAAMGEDLVKALSDEKRWKGAGDKKNAYKFSAEEAKGFKELASREDMQKLQLDKMKEDVAGYMKIMKQRGITGAAEQIFYADMMHQVGEGGVIKGTGGYTDLASMYEMSRGFDGGKHANRRDNVFNTLSNLKIVEPTEKAATIESVKTAETVKPTATGESFLERMTRTLTSAAEETNKKLTEAFDTVVTRTTEAMQKVEPGKSLDSVSDINKHDDVPDKILNFVFGVNPGGSYSENIFSME